MKKILSFWWLPLVMSTMVFLADVVGLFDGGISTVAAQPQPTLAGQYLCEGRNGDGSTYQLDLEVRAEGDSYQFAWFWLGEQRYGGFGVYEDGHAAVVFSDADGHIAVTLYRFVDGALRGTWTAGDGELYIETCSAGRRA